MPNTDLSLSENSQSPQSDPVPSQVKNSGQSLFQRLMGKIFTSGHEIIERRRVQEELEAHIAELKEANRSLEEFKKSTLNALEELETSKANTEQEKVRDEATLESIGDGVIVTDQDGRIKIINQSSQEILGWRASKSDLVGKKWPEALVLEDETGNPIPLDKQPVQIVLSSGKKVVETNYYCVRKDKTRFPAAITSSPVILNGKTVGAVVVFWDITRERELENAKDYFLSVAAHQLRTPLGSMRWNMEMLLSGDVGQVPEPVKKTLQEIYDSNQRMIVLVNDLLGVSRIDQNRVQDKPESTDILEIIKTEIGKMDMEIKKRSVTIDLELKKDHLPPIVLDPNRFRVVIQNVLNNAVKYNRHGGKVNIQVVRKDNQIQINIADNGIGIPRKDQGKIFLKFFRADNAVRSETEGSGLGLFVAKSYIEAWGGRVWFESEEEKGTTFTLTLPLEPKQYTLDKNIDSRTSAVA